MKSRTPRNTIMMMILIMFVGFLLNIEVLLPFKDENFIQRGWVKGITIYEGGCHRQLGITQQGEMLRLLNESLCLNETEAELFREEKVDWGFDKIVIKQYAKQDIQLLPSGVSEGKMVFVVTGRETAACVLETNQTKLNQILIGRPN